jgi:hypothetical protein
VARSAREISDLIHRFNSILREIQQWPKDAEHRQLLDELRHTKRILDEEVPPVSEPLF